MKGAILNVKNVNVKDIPNTYKYIGLQFSPGNTHGEKLLILYMMKLVKVRFRCKCCSHPYTCIWLKIFIYIFSYV